MLRASTDASGLFLLTNSLGSSSVLIIAAFALAGHVIDSHELWLINLQLAGDDEETSMKKKGKRPPNLNFALDFFHCIL